MVFCLSSFVALASCRMLVERKGKGKKETESDSSKLSCRRKRACFAPWFWYIVRFKL